MLTITDKQYQELESVNRSVNANVEYKTDKEQYGVEDKWTYPTRFGDCEDYVLLKRSKLEKLGWPILELRIAICYTEDKFGHAVLSVDTDRGTLILDNRQKRVVQYDYLKSLGYKFVSRQDGKVWRSIT